MKKYKVSQELMNDIDNWKDEVDGLVVRVSLDKLSQSMHYWWRDPHVDFPEQNNRLIALIRYVNGEDVFEVEKPKKWIVRSKKTNGSYRYDYLSRFYAGTSSPKYGVKDLAIYFDTKEEAEKWTNPLMEAVEYEEIADGEFEDREFLDLWEVEDD